MRTMKYKGYNRRLAYDNSGLGSKSASSSTALRISAKQKEKPAVIRVPGDYECSMLKFA